MIPELISVWGYAIIGLILFLGVAYIIMGCRNSRVTKAAFYDEKHPLHKRALKIYKTTYSSGLPSEGENIWEMELAIGLVLLSIPAALIIGTMFESSPDGGTQSQVTKIAKLYVFSYLLLIPIFFYIIIAFLGVLAINNLYRGFRRLIGKPLPPKYPDTPQRHYHPKPPGCRFPGDYYSGED